MKKVSFNFTSAQYTEFSELAKRNGITFAESIRNALDDWLMSRKKGLSMTVQTNGCPNVTVILADPRWGDDGVLYYDNATVNEIDDELTVWRNDKLVARFNSKAVDSWFTE